MNDKKQTVVAIDPNAMALLKKEEEEKLKKAEGLGSSPSQPDSVLGMILKSLKNHSAQEMERMSFEIDPQRNYSGVHGFYRMKTGLTPDHIIKRVIGPQGDELVCQILQARSNHASSFGRPRTDRFSVGFEIQDMDKNAIRTEEQQRAIQEKIDRSKKILWNCGHGALDDEETDRVNLSQLFKLITRDGLAYGRFAVERVWGIDKSTGKKYMYAFRASDAGTIYKILPQSEKDQSLRVEALRVLEQMKNKKIDVEKYKKDEYRWVQTIEGKPVQAFTADELVVHNMYPVTNVEYNGYPLTPIDQALNAITTHINITVHNKLYFQHGRAAKGMLVFNSDDIDEGMVQRIRLQFHQSINSVQNSWRMPVFGLGTNDKLEWKAIDTSGRDAEFQYLLDNNARTILSAFQISPEELPGYAHLARGTNTQALSESDNEWKLTAARDVGLRPLVYELQDFLNTHILPHIDPELAKTHQIVLAGLEKDSPEKEATRLQQDSAIHMTYNEIMESTEKNPVPKELGGDFPLNPQFQQVLGSYLTVGEILENFFGKKGATQDPRYQYVRDPFWFQYQQILLQKAQMAMQQQMMVEQQMQQQMMMQQQQAQGFDPSQEGGEGAEEQSGGEKAQEGMEKAAKWSTAQFELLGKAITDNHNTISKQLLVRHQNLVDQHMNKWKEESKKATKKMSDALKTKKGE